MRGAFVIGEHVEVVSHRTWCGEDVFGEVGEVVEINFYPAHIIDGGAIYSVRRPARTPIPLTAAELRRVAA